VSNPAPFFLSYCPSEKCARRFFCPAGLVRFGANDAPSAVADGFPDSRLGRRVALGITWRHSPGDRPNQGCISTSLRPRSAARAPRRTGAPGRRRGWREGTEPRRSNPTGHCLDVVRCPGAPAVGCPVIPVLNRMRHRRNNWSKTRRPGIQLPKVLKLRICVWSSRRGGAAFESADCR
jgi:hypothetical protein